MLLVVDQDQRKLSIGIRTASRKEKAPETHGTMMRTNCKEERPTHGNLEYKVRFTDGVTGGNPHKITMHQLFHPIVLYVACHDIRKPLKDTKSL